MATTQGRTMPVDFAAYLLDASPPGFGFYNLRNEFFRSAGKQGPVSGESRGAALVKACSDVSRGFHTDTSTDNITKTFMDYCRVTSPDGDQCLIDTNGDRSTCSNRPTLNLHGSKDLQTASTRSPSRSDPSSPAPRAGKKKVSFADDLGLALVKVRFMTEPSSTPPRLRPEILSSLTHGAKAGVSATPPLRLNFTQPASDYLEFRRKLEINCVSLENVIIKNYDLMGTIKVKNIGFEKEVFLRCTFDSWATTENISAAFTPTSTSGGQFDTFSFSIRVPAKTDFSKNTMFCVCFLGGGQEFWDNNDGKNYEVVSADWRPISEPTHCTYPRDEETIFSLDFDRDWTVYSSWAHRNASTPYY